MTFLDTLRALDAQATPGPWTKVCDRHDTWGMVEVAGPGVGGHIVTGFTLTTEAEPRDSDLIHADAEIIATLRNSAPRIAALVEAVAKAVQSVPPSFFDAANAPSGPDQTVAYAVDYSHLTNIRAAIAALDEVKS